jgi:hypothetical protein
LYFLIPVYVLVCVIGRGGAASDTEIKVVRLFLDALAIAAIGAYLMWALSAD